MYWINTIVQGALVGGLYALFATGLSLMFGVMRIINIAHGDFIVMSAYLAVVVMGLLGVDPLISLAIVVPAFIILPTGQLALTLGASPYTLVFYLALAAAGAWHWWGRRGASVPALAGR